MEGHGDSDDSIPFGQAVRAAQNLEVTPNSTITDILAIGKEPHHDRSSRGSRSGANSQFNTQKKDQLQYFTRTTDDGHLPKSVVYFNNPENIAMVREAPALASKAASNRCKVNFSSLLQDFKIITGKCNLSRNQIESFARKYGMELEDDQNSLRHANLHSSEQCDRSEEYMDKTLKSIFPQYNQDIYLSDIDPSQAKRATLSQPNYGSLIKLEPSVKLYSGDAEDSNLESNQTDNQRSPSFRNRRKNSKYQMLSTQEKLNIVNLSNSMSINQVSKKFGVSINNICRWRKRCDRKPGAGRKVHDPQMERSLINWIQNFKGSILTRQQIRLRAVQLAQDKKFKASKGWFQRFANRNRALLRSKGYGGACSSNNELSPMEQD